MELTILGGGPAGLAAAYYAHRKGLPFNLFEGSDGVGGLCRTLRCGTHRYDTGAHRFHDRFPDITEDVKRLVGSDLRPVSSPSKVLINGRLFDFPPTPINAVLSNGLAESTRVALDLLKSRMRQRPLHSFADFAENRFGRRLAQRFLINYSEKVWGLPADQLSPDVATRRLSGMSLGAFLIELFFPSRKTTHLDGQFLYPREGYGQICESLQRALPPGSIRTGHRVSGLEVRDRRIVEVAFERQEPIPVRGHLISTLPLTLLARLAGQALCSEARKAAGELRFRSIRLIFFRLRRPTVSPYATIYLPEASICFSRVHEPRNRSLELAPFGETGLVAEVPCFQGDSHAMMSDDELVSRVARELAEVSLINTSEIVEWRHHWLANAYPVFSLGYDGRVQAIMEALSGLENLRLVGRQGRFFYSHLHHQMRFGKKLVAELAARGQKGPLCP